MGQRRSEKGRERGAGYPTSPVRMEEGRDRNGFSTPAGSWGRSHVAIPMPISEEGEVFGGMGGLDGRLRNGVMGAGSLSRSHSSLWEFWNHLGSGRHDIDISNEGVLLHASPPKRSPQPSHPRVEMSRQVARKERPAAASAPAPKPKPCWVRFGSVMKYRRARLAILCLWLLLGLALAAYVAGSLTLQAERAWDAELQEDCDGQARAGAQTFLQNALQVEVLRGLIETFHTNTSTPTLTQAVFAQYMAATKFARPLVRSVLYADRVVDAKRPTFRHLTRKPILDIHGEVLRAQAQVYGPIIFTDSPQEQSHGGYLDILQIPELQAAASQATNTSRAALSAPLLWPGETAPTLAMLLPFYSRNFSVSGASESERQAQAVGWLVAAFDVKTLIETLPHEKGHYVRMHVYDVSDAAADGQVATLYSPNFAGSNLTANVREGSVVSALVLGDPVREFELWCSREEGLPFPWRAAAWGAAILVITLLVAHLMRSAGKRIAAMETAYNEMRELRDQTMDAKLAAEQADNSKSQFLATVSHEIRTPLNGVLGMLSLLKDTKLDAVQIDYVQTAVSSGKALIGLINDVLDFSKIEAGKMEIDSAVFDIRSELDDVLSLFAEKVRNRHVELAALVQLAVPSTLVGDSGRVRQVLINLIGNATKFTEHGHILVTIRLLEDDEDLRELHTSPALLHGTETVASDEDDATPSSPLPEATPPRRRRSSISSLVRFPGVAFTLTSSQPGDSDQWSGSNHHAGSHVSGDGGGEQRRAAQGKKNGSRSRQGSKPGSRAESRRASVCDDMGGGTATTGRYTTLSGCPTASGAHTYDKVMKWMHRKPPKMAGKTVRLAISVEDTGSGIPLAAQGHIFQPFRQADSSTSRKAGGTGIGLSISKRLVELQGGSMAFVSKPTIGSTFFFDLRLGVPDAAQAAAQNQAQKLGLPQVDSLPGHRVLLVDSGKVRRKVLATHLRALGVLVDMADSPAQAIYMAQSFLAPPPGGGHASKAPEEEAESEPEPGLVPPAPATKLKRTRSYEYLDAKLPGGGSRRPSGRRRSMEGFAEAAKAVGVGLGFLSPFSSSSSSYFGSTPSHVGSSPHRLTTSPVRNGAADPPSPSPRPSSRSARPDSAKVDSFRDGSGRLDGGRSPSPRSNARRSAAAAFPPEAELARLDSAGRRDAPNPEAAASRNLPGKPELQGYAAILIDSDSPQWEKRGLELGELAQSHGQLARVPLVLVLQAADATLERAARQLGFRAMLLKPLRRMSVAVALIQALGLASSEHVAQMRACPGGSSNAAQLSEVLKGRRILCVDDNLVNRRVAAKMLAKYGVEAVCAPSGAAALEILSTQPPMDLIFMDLQMPEMDGYETSHKIRELEKLGTVGALGNTPRRLPIIAMTADVLKGTREKCLASGMDGYITKPIDTNELFRTVTRFFPAAKTLPSSPVHQNGL